MSRNSGERGATSLGVREAKLDRDHAVAEAAPDDEPAVAEAAPHDEPAAPTLAVERRRKRRVLRRAA